MQVIAGCCDAHAASVHVLIHAYTTHTLCASGLQEAILEGLRAEAGTAE